MPLLLFLLRCSIRGLPRLSFIYSGNLRLLRLFHVLPLKGPRLRVATEYVFYRRVLVRPLMIPLLINNEVLFRSMLRNTTRNSIQISSAIHFNGGLTMSTAEFIIYENPIILCNFFRRRSFHIKRPLPRNKIHRRCLTKSGIINNTITTRSHIVMNNGSMYRTFIHFKVLPNRNGTFFSSNTSI